MRATLTRFRGVSANGDRQDRPAWCERIVKADSGKVLLIDQFVSVPTPVKAALAMAALTHADQPAPGDVHRCPIPVSANACHTETARSTKCRTAPEDTHG